VNVADVDAGIDRPGAALPRRDSLDGLVLHRSLLIPRLEAPET
jgi:hypothetical protein